MSDENLAHTVAADPQLVNTFISQTQQSGMQVPATYEMEIREILETKISLLPNVDSPEDYKTLVQALYVINTCKQRVAVMRHHLKGLHYKWSQLQRQSRKFVETKYFRELSGVRADASKSIVTHAIEPVTGGVEQLDYLVHSADIAQKHLDDIGWAVRHSCEMVSAYFTSIRTHGQPREL